MKYNFDEIVNRKNTNSKKHDGALKRGKPQGLTSMWIADMDFLSPFEVVEAVKEKAEHGVYGYSEPLNCYYDALINWIDKTLSFKIKREWVVNTSGIVLAIATAINAFSKEGDGILVQCPVYYPFLSVIKNNNRRIVNSPLYINYDANQYEINFEDFEKKIIDEKVKIFVLCSPHNPVGRVWSKSELSQIGEICLKHNVLVISDEIHANIVYRPNCHTFFSSIDKRFLDNSIVCFSASKTFNLGGLQFSDIIIANDDLRERFIKECDKCGCNHPNIFGIVASKAAYQSGEQWQKELLTYLEGNIKLLNDFVNSHSSKLKLIPPQGTFLAWLDFRQLKMSHDELYNSLIDEARLWFDNGTTFGMEGNGFMRMNFACPRSVLLKALTQLEIFLEKK